MSRAVNPYWWVGLVIGILLVLLAFWVSGSDRVYALAQRSYLILFWVGFLALFRGFSQIFWPSPSATPERKPRPLILRARADQGDLQGAEASPGGVATFGRWRCDQARRPSGRRSPTRPVGGGGSV